MTSEAVAGSARATDKQQTVKALRLRIVRFTALSWIVDTLLLAGLWVEGSLPYSIVLGYCVAAMLSCGLTLAAYLTGWNLRFARPGLEFPQLVFACIIQVTCLYIAPQVGFFFLIAIFDVFAFGLLSTNLRQFILTLVFTSALVAAVLWSVGSEIAFPLNTALGKVLLYLTFVAALSRCVMLGVYVGSLREKLHRQNRILQETLARIEELASHDELTGVPNRRSLLRILREEMDRSDRTGMPFCTALLDLDNFKLVNDRHGHLAGDAVLKQFSVLATASLRSTDSFGRYGGEDFLMVLTGIDRDGSSLPVERLRAIVAAYDWSVHDIATPITASVGVAQYVNGETVEQLISRADNAMYAAKVAGRDCIKAA
jgi:diguanylate cyclase (GGDEF)-like protein